MPENIKIRIDRREKSKSIIVYGCKICEKESFKKYCEKNKDKIRNLSIKNRKKHKIKYQITDNIRINKKIKECAITYCKRLIIRKGTLAYKDIPDEMAEIKRYSILIKRKIKELGK